MPPVIVTPVGHNIVSLGESAILPCGIYSDPSPTVTWYKGNLNLDFTQNLKIDFGRVEMIGWGWGGGGAKGKYADFQQIFLLPHFLFQKYFCAQGKKLKSFADNRVVLYKTNCSVCNTN